MSRTLDSYKREQAILNKVLESEKGLVATFETAKEAKGFRVNCYAFRKLDREKASEGLDPMDPKKHQSPYDLIKLELLCDYRRKVFKVQMKNCRNILQTQGVESLIDLSTGADVDVATYMPPIGEDFGSPAEAAQSLEEEMEAELKDG